MDKGLLLLALVVAFLVGRIVAFHSLVTQLVSFLAAIGFYFLLACCSELLDRLEEERTRRRIQAFFRGDTS